MLDTECRMPDEKAMKKCVISFGKTLKEIQISV